MPHRIDCFSSCVYVSAEQIVFCFFSIKNLEKNLAAVTETLTDKEETILQEVMER